jgi:hypothetical protein
VLRVLLVDGEVPREAERVVVLGDDVDELGRDRLERDAGVAEEEAVAGVRGLEHARHALHRQAEVPCGGLGGGGGRERRGGGGGARGGLRHERAVHADDAAGRRDVGAGAGVVDLDAVDALAEVEVGDAVVAADVLVGHGHVGEVGGGEAERGAPGLEVVEHRGEGLALRQSRLAPGGGEEEQE